MNVKIQISATPEQLGQAAAEKIAVLLRAAIAKKGAARIILSTGASQFETISALIQQDIEWDKVEMFHLDEYVGLPESHIASFRKYLKERFVAKVNLKAAYFVNGEGDVEANIAALTKELRRSPVDVGVIGIGENAHIAFNDPPANFAAEEAYLVLDLDEKCKQQQVGEGWFDTVADVPVKAITMSVKQIMACEHIVSAVPHKVKAEAVKNTLTMAVTNTVPATILKTHPDWNLFIDDASASGLFLV